VIESKVMKQIQLGLGQMAHLKLFRNNVGLGWVGKLIRRAAGDRGLTVTLDSARPLHAGLCVGSGDLIGWEEIVITDAMVGKTIAQFVSVEVKGQRTKTTEEQIDWAKAVRNAGGKALIVMSESQAIKAFKK